MSKQQARKPIPPRRKKRKAPLIPGSLVIVYLAAVALRFLLTVLISSNPTILPDEMLYSNIAKSLVAQGKVLMRGQPAVYESLLYPLFLIPMYLLPDFFDMFRGLQLYNALLMTSAIFPGYLLAKRLLKKEGYAWLAVLFLLLLPDMALSDLLIAESLCYPLFFWMLYMALRAFDGPFRWRDAVVCAALGAAMYFAKPGLIAFPAVFCGVLFLAAARRHSRPQLTYAAGTSVLLLVFLGVIQLLCKFVFQVPTDETSLYAEQLEGLSLTNLYVMLQGLLLYLYFLPMASCVLPAILPFAGMGRMDESKKYFMLAVGIALTVTILGVCYAIYLHEWFGLLFAGRIHIRYLAPYIPVLAMLLMSEELLNRKYTWSTVIPLALLFAANLLFTPNASFLTGQERMDSLTLTIFSKDWGGAPTRTIVEILLALGTAAAGLVLWRRGWTKGVRAAFLCVFGLVMLLSNISAYSLLGSGNIPELAQDAREAYKLTKGHTLLYLSDNEYHSRNGYALDVRFRTPLEATAVNDMATSMLNSDGTYTPFVPRAYWPTYPDHETPDADMIVVEGGLWPVLKLAPGIQATSTSNGQYYLVPIIKGKPWLSSILAGQRNNSVKAGTVCTLVLFSHPSDTVRVKLRVRTDNPQTMMIQSSGTTTSIPISSEDVWQEVTLSFAGSGVEQIDMYCAEADMTVQGYEILE